MASHIHNVQTNSIPYDEFENFADDLANADIIVVCLNFEMLYPNISIDRLSKKVTSEDIQKDCERKCKELYSFVMMHSQSHIIWLGFEDYFCYNNIICGTISAFDGIVDKVNAKLTTVFENVSFIDLKRLIAMVGISNAYDCKGKYRWAAPYSKSLIRVISEEIHKQYLIHTGLTKKCLVLDCDNVLWGGILSEDGIEGIQVSSSGLGKPFQDFQRFLLEMYYHGVILTICSKNDEADVRRVFRHHSGMLLREEHISCFCCNWDNKSDNIKAMADNLNIGLESMVFVDDSKFEIEAVKSMLVDVKTVLFHRDTIYRDLSCFNLRSNPDMQTIKERISTYRTNIKRAELKRTASSFDEYISSLEMKTDIHKTLDQELARVSELTQRTNKCTNGVRYTLEQLKAKINAEEYELYTVCLTDRFSDLGVVGAIGISKQGLDLFSLSCRALGRKIEDMLLSWLLEKKLICARYIKTGKNEVLRNLFHTYGLKIIE